MTPVICKIKGRLYQIGVLPQYGSCTIEWISRYTGIDPDNVKNIEKQPERWLVTLVNP
jgi:hypothetical protein